MPEQPLPRAARGQRWRAGGAGANHTVTALGPLFRHELARLARRGLQPRWRAAFAALLLAALFVCYLSAFPDLGAASILIYPQGTLSIPAAARFAENFFFAFLLVQLVVVLVLTPPLVGGSVTEEREKGSLDFLLSSPLTDREIVLGKFAARFVFVGCVVLTGLPVLALSLLFGGVDGGVLLASYAITLATAFSLGAFGLYSAADGAGFGRVLYHSYAAVVVVLVGGLCCNCMSWHGAVLSPLSAVWALTSAKEPDPNKPFFVGGSFAIAHVSTGLFFLWLAGVAIRSKSGGRQKPRGPDSRFVHAIKVADNPWHVERRPSRADNPWPVAPPPSRPVGVVARIRPGENPVTWKDRGFGPSLLPDLDDLLMSVAIPSAALALAGLAFILFFVIVEAIKESGEMGKVTGPAARVAFAVFWPPFLTAAGYLASSAVGRERQRQTLDPLFALPWDRRDILTAKAEAVLQREAVGRRGAGGGPGGRRHGRLVARVRPDGAAIGRGVAGVGRRAGLLAVGALRVAVPGRRRLPGRPAGRVVPAAADGRLPRADESFAAHFVRSLSPSVAAWDGLPGRFDFHAAPEKGAAAALLSTLAAAAMAVVLWWDAGRRFEREGK